LPMMTTHGPDVACEPENPPPGCRDPNAPALRGNDTQRRSPCPSGEAPTTTRDPESGSFTGTPTLGRCRFGDNDRTTHYVARPMGSARCGSAR
jgi:hypothetical protein